MASTWRSLLPVAMTNTSVIASRSLTSMSTMSVASLSAAAWAAIWASWTECSVAVTSATVQIVLADVLHYSVGHQVPDGLPVADACPAVAGRDGHRRHVDERHGVHR